MYDKEIIGHLESMCYEPGHVRVVSAEEIKGGAVFAVFAFEECDGTESEQAAIYYPGDDTLFTPTDWQQGRRPETVDEIGDFEWMSSADDDALVVDGLPRALFAIREEYRKDFGRRVQAARCDKGLSQTELARLAGLKQTTVSRIESGRFNVTLDTMARLSVALGEI